MPVKMIRNFWNASIVNKLTVLFATSLFIVLFLSAAILYAALSKILIAESNAILRDRVEAISNILENEDRPLDDLKKRIELEWATRRSERIYIKMVASKSGDILVASPEIPIEFEKMFVALPIHLNEENYIVGTRFDLSSGSAWLGTARLMHGKAGQLQEVRLYAALEMGASSSILSGYRNALAAVLILTLMISVFLGLRLARLSFQPVDEIIRTTQRIRSSSLHERINETNLPSELRMLAVTINEMLDRLGESFDRLSRFSADIAHELRTPVNNVLGEIEVALRSDRNIEEYREVIFSNLEEMRRISKMIDSLLFLARAETTEQFLNLEKIVLKTEVANLCNYYEASADDEGIRFQIDISDNLILHGNRTLFQRTLTNLFSNSINHTSKGGTVWVSARKNEGGLQIVVQDSGKGIAPADLPKVFDRFYRADPSRTATKLGGFGLGLTIVQSAMNIHRGTVKIESEFGKGTKVTLSFPDHELK